MGVVRTWVFPILRLVLFAVIAVALVKFAFFPDVSADARDPDFPSATIVEPQVEVVLGTIQNDVTLTGTVAADDAVPVPATLSGEVREVMVGQGAGVTAGQPLLRLRAEVQNADGGVSTKWETITAPVDGVLSSFTALVGQSFSVGDAVGKVAPPSFNVSGSIPPRQLYRLLNSPTEAQVTINGGPAPFACTGLTITSPIAGAEPGAGAEGAANGPTVRCAVPPEITVFPGLQAELVIAGGVAENALIVPITAVEGTSGTGNVYAVLDDGSTELRPVTLGINDGANVQVVDGLAEGDLVLQFVPGAEAEEVCDPMSGMMCEG